MAEETTKAKRVRRTFATIILEKFDAKAAGIDEGKYSKFRLKLEGLCEEFEQLKKDAKSSDRRKFKSLKKFTKEELEEYLKTL